jgi:hypothetical protein
MLAVPACEPVTIPVDEPTGATYGELLLHVPPPGLEVRVVVEPMQIGDVPPEIDTGVAVTVTIAVSRPSDPFHEIIAVPADTPETIPVAEPIVATARLPLLQYPVDAESWLR